MAKRFRGKVLTGSRSRSQTRSRSNSRGRAGAAGSSAMYSTGLTAYTPIWRMKSVCDKRIFPILMQNNVNYPYVPNTGINGTGNFDISFCATQSAIYYTQNNGALNTVNGTWQNYANLAAVFQQYRIISFDIDLYFTNNSASNVSGSTTGNSLPMVYAIIDREDDRAVQSTTDMLQYSSCKIMQMGNSSGSNNGRQSIRMPHPTVFGAVDNAASLVGTIQASSILNGPWLACGTNSASSVAATIPHGWLKFFVDPCGNTNSGGTGQFCFIFRVLFEYRGID